MAKIKTTVNDASVEAFVTAVTPESTREDCSTLIALMEEITRCQAKMWGSSIVGFDTYRYRYADGKPGEMCLIGFSPRKRNLVLYITDNHERDADLLAKLGKIKTGRGCIYVNDMRDLHLPTLKQLIRRAIKARKETSVD
jgi:hypothetical protein